MFKKRKDAYYCYDVSQYQKIFPYLFKRRCDSLVFYEIEYDVTALTAFVKQYNREHRDEFKSYNETHDDKKFPLRFTTAVLIAFMRTLTIRPKMNRFIKNKEFWQRKENTLMFIVKKALDEDSPETSEQLTFDPFGTFDSYVQEIEGYINKCESLDPLEANKSDMLIGKVFKFLPKFLISFIVKMLDFFDTKNGVGKWLAEADGMHSSVFVANLSSLGISSTAPHHHLYEWGTTSIFSILGPVVRNRLVDESGNVTDFKDTMKISFTIDERICDGFYFVKTLGVIGDFLKFPEKLLHIPTPDEIPHLMTKKEYKANLKKKKAEIKASKRARRAKGVK